MEELNAKRLSEMLEAMSVPEVMRGKAEAGKMRRANSRPRVKKAEHLSFVWLLLSSSCLFQLRRPCS